MNLPWEIENVIFDSIFDMVRESGNVENVEDAIKLYLKLSTQLRIKVLDTIHSIYLRSDKRKLEGILTDSKLFDEIKGILIYGTNLQKYTILKYLGEIEDEDFINFIKNKVFDETIEMNIIKLYYTANTLKKRVDQGVQIF